MFTVGLVVLLWFVVGITSLLRRVEEEPPWRSTIALASGAKVWLATKPDAVPSRSDDLDPQIAQPAFDQGNVSFANSWVALGSFTLCCGWVIASTGFLPRWLGWWAVISGIGLALSRAAWTNQIWLLPYLMFWLWVLAVSVLLIRRSTTGVTTDS